MTRQPPAPTPTATGANALYDLIRDQAWTMYTRLPTLLCTTRTGTLDGAYSLNRRTDTYEPTEALPLDFAEADLERAHLARLIVAYAEHDERNEQLLTRYERFPLSIDLYLG